LEEAEKQKWQIDIRKGDTEASVLIKAIQPILNELKTAFKYFEKTSNEKVEEIIIVGGSAKVKGLIEYLSANLEMKVKVGTSILRDKKAKLLYLEAIGLAIRGVDKKWDKIDPAIPNETVSESIVKEKKEPKIEIQEKFGEKEEVVDKSKRYLFLSIIIIGIILLALSFWYRNNQRQKRQLIKEQAIERINSLPVIENPVIENKEPVIDIIEEDIEQAEE